MCKNDVPSIIFILLSTTIFVLSGCELASDKCDHPWGSSRRICQFHTWCPSAKQHNRWPGCSQLQTQVGLRSDQHETWEDQQISEFFEWYTSVYWSSTFLSITFILTVTFSPSTAALGQSATIDTAKEGFILDSTKRKIVAGETNQTFQIFLSPKLIEGEHRLLLSWQTLQDIDLHILQQDK